MATNSNQAIARMSPGFPIRQYLKRPKKESRVAKESAPKPHLPPMREEQVLLPKNDPYVRTAPKTTTRRPCRSCGGGRTRVTRSYISRG